MRVAAYVQLRRTLVNPTGVGRHMTNMVMGLSRVPDVDVTVLASRNELQVDGTIDPASPLRMLPLVSLPLSRALMERVWWLLRFPKAEHYVPRADWVYCAADAYVPTRRAAFATTLHDVETFEPDLPWSNTPENLHKRRMWSLRLAPMIRHARLIVTVSEFSKSRIVELLKVDPKRIAVVYNGVDERFFDAQNQTAPNPAKLYSPYVALVGGLSERKGSDYSIAVARELQKLGSRLKLVVAGRSDAKYAAMARECPNIVELGFVEDAQLPAFLGGASCLFFPSRYEGFGMPILESMACGTPAVVAAFSSLPEVAAKAGIVVDVQQPAAVAQTLIRLADQTPERAALVQLGLEHARKFTWDFCVRQLLNAMQAAS